MAKKGTLLTAIGIAVSFACLVGTTLFLRANNTVTPEMAKLMLVALFGLYFGFGVLIAAYRLVSKLE